MSHNGYGHMVLDYYVERLREKRAERASIMQNLKTREDALRYRDYVRKVVDAAFVKPTKKVPLDPVITGSLQCEGYRIEKVCVTSRPGFWVTTSLYIPDGLTGKAPAVIAACGHSEDGKACDTYQEFCIRLVRNGFVVMMVDPIQQGERNQYVHVKELGIGAGLCASHNMMGKQLDLLGDSFGSWRAWDNRCALDYLLTRPEVDVNHVGITGNSGGGTMTEYTFACEDRFTMAAPSCHVTSYLTNLENELPTDAEQCPIGVIGAGLEMVDLLIAQAPKPVKLLGQKYDFFERRGLKEAYADLKRFYDLLGEGDKVELFIGPTTHGYSRHNQEAMVEFFRRQCGMAGEPYVFEPKVHTAEELNVFPEGNVVLAGSRPIYDLMTDMVCDEEHVWEALPETTDGWKALVKKLLQMPSATDVPHYRIPRAVRLDDKWYARYAVETERFGIRAIMKKRLVTVGYAQTLDVEEDVHVFLPNFSSEDDLCTNDWAKSLNPDGPLYAIDARGIGESMQEEQCGGFLQAYGTDFMMHCFGVMFNESYFGRRVFDVLRTLDLLVAEGAKTIHLHGLGQGALVALYAALLNDHVVSIEEHDSTESYRSWIYAKVVDIPSSSALRGVLKYFDLPLLRDAVQKALAERQ